MDRQRALTKVEVRDILDRIKFRDWNFRLLEKEEPGQSGSDFLVQAVFLAADEDKPGSTPIAQHCRKWYVSRYSTVTEVVRTVYKAVQTAMAHEVDETFRYRGKRIFSPHYDVDKLASGELDGARADKRRGGPAGGKRK